MIMSIVAILLMGLVGYVWSARGFFSALLNLGVTLASGAIAFGLYETVALSIMSGTAAENRFMRDIAWGGSLMGLFVVSLVVLSLVVNMLVRSNIIVGKAADWAGGAACGIGAGVIVSGVTVISTSQIRTAALENILQYQGVDYDNNGFLLRQNLIVPVDRWTAGLYGYTSERSMRETFGGGRTLAAWRPHVADEGYLARIAESEVLLRYALAPSDVSFAGRYTVGKVPPGRGQKAPTLTQLIGDNKSVKTVSGEDIAGQGWVEGFIVTFHSGAKEKSGQVAVGAGSASLVLRNEADDRSLVVPPIAVISQASGGAMGVGRWRFDTRNFFIGSVGGQSDAAMAFEFLVPNDGENWTPLALYVRGVRFELVDEFDTALKSGKDYALPSERDAAMDGNDLFGAVAAATAVSNPDFRIKIDRNATDSPIRLSARIPNNITLNGGELSGVELSPGQQIINAVDLRLSTKQKAGNDVDRSLRVEEFQPGPGTAIVTVNVSRDIKGFSSVEDASINAKGPPRLIDHLGQKYEAIGYVYEDRSEMRFRFTPGRPLSGLGDAPSISRSRDDQRLYLVFRVAQGVKLKQYAIGDVGIAEMQGEVEVPTNQQNK